MWILNFDWIILHGNHSIHGTYVTCCERLPSAGKTGKIYRFCCKAVGLHATQRFRNLQQPDLLQDRPNSWLLNRAAINMQIKLHIFRSPFYHTFTNLICVNQIKIARYHYYSLFLQRGNRLSILLCHRHPRPSHHRPPDFHWLESIHIF